MPNHLAQETSPYLQQHARNPVDWFPWGEEALHCAREQPAGFMSMLMVLQEYLTPPQIVTLHGAPGASAAWRRQLLQHYWPSTMILALKGELSGLPETLAKLGSQEVSAWICQGVKCLPAIDDCQKLMDVCQSGETS